MTKPLKTLKRWNEKEYMEDKFCLSHTAAAAAAFSTVPSVNTTVGLTAEKNNGLPALVVSTSRARVQQIIKNKLQVLGII